MICLRRRRACHRHRRRCHRHRRRHRPRCHRRHCRRHRRLCDRRTVANLVANLVACRRQPLDRSDAEGGGERHLLDPQLGAGGLEALLYRPARVQHVAQRVPVREKQSLPSPRCRRRCSRVGLSRSAHDDARRAAAPVLRCRRRRRRGGAARRGKGVRDRLGDAHPCSGARGGGHLLRDGYALPERHLSCLQSLHSLRCQCRLRRLRRLCRL